VIAGRELKREQATMDAQAGYVREFDPEVMDSLMGGNATADRALALRTRRAIYSAQVARRSDREQGRRQFFIILLIAGAFVFAMAPALWAAVDDLLGGETLLDLPGMVIAFGITLFAALASVFSLLTRERDTAAVQRHPRR
jgi:hypothetical protein